VAALQEQEFTFSGVVGSRPLIYGANGWPIQRSNEQLEEGQPLCLRDKVNRSNLQTTRLGKIKPTGERFARYSSDDLSEKIEPPSGQQYKPGDILTVGPLNWNEIIEGNNAIENWVYPGAPSCGRSRDSYGNDNDDSQGEKDTQGGEKGTGKGKGRKDGNRKGKRKAMETGKGKGKGNCKGKGVVKQTPGGDDISRGVAVQL